MDVEDGEEDNNLVAGGVNEIVGVEVDNILNSAVGGRDD